MKLHRILLIDDDEQNNFAMRHFLKNYILEEDLTIQTNGWEAIEFLERVKQRKEDAPQLIIVDLKMPDMDGFEFLGYYKKNFHKELSKSKLIVVTSSGRQKDKAKALEYECVTDFLTKPLTDPDMLKIIDNHFRKKGEFS